MPEDLESICKRLDRIEQTLSRASFLDRLVKIIADPAPEDLFRARSSIAQLYSVMANKPPHGDPAVTDWARLPQGGVDEIAAELYLRKHIGDPAVEDLARLAKPELEAQLHKVKTEQIRLQSLEKLITERIGSQTTSQAT